MISQKLNRWCTYALFGYILFNCHPIWATSCSDVLSRGGNSTYQYYLDRLSQISPNLQQRLESRKVRIERIIKEANGDPNTVFSLIFGVDASGLEMMNTEFGLYFYGSYEVFRRVYPQLSELLHGGAMVGIENKHLLQRTEFAGMVGFGSKGSSEHEIEHMLNDMILETPYKEFNSIVVDVSRPKDVESMRDVYEKKYRLWAESNLKDEILVRISNGQINQVRTQKSSDAYFGDGFVFTSYEPRSLFPFMSPYESEAKPYGVEPLSRNQSDIFEERERGVLDPIRERWLNIYNQTILEIQAALSRNVSADEIKMAIITNNLPQVPNILSNL